MSVFFPPGKQPFTGLIFAPIGTKLRKQASGKNRVTIFIAFSLFNPDHHPGRIAFNMFRPETNGFTEAESCAIDRFEQNPVFQIARYIK